jgi:hypothetical protein
MYSASLPLFQQGMAEIFRPSIFTATLYPRYAFIMDTINDINQNPGKEEKISKNHNKLLGALLGVAVLGVIGLSVALWWCLYHRETPTSSSSSPATTAAVAGPCKDGAANTLPAGYMWYENAALGYKFAYPTAWGAVTMTIDAMGGVGGHYAHASFASKPNASFGGNATDYVVNARDGTLLDNPGYLEATSKFYAVQIWKLHTAGSPDEQKLALYPLPDPTVLKDGCNAKATVTQYPFDEFFGNSHDIARFNLQPTNAYYGVNMVLTNPSAADRADLDKIITSFQLIP